MLTDVAAVVIALAAVATSLGVLSRLRAVRWLWRTVVAGPLRCWAQTEVIGPAVDARIQSVQDTVEGIDRAVNHRDEGEPRLVEQVDNAAGAIEDVRQIAARTETKVTDTATRVTLLEQRVGGVEGRIGRCEGELCQIKDRLAS